MILILCYGALTTHFDTLHAVPLASGVVYCRGRRHRRHAVLQAANFAPPCAHTSSRVHVRAWQAHKPVWAHWQQQLNKLANSAWKIRTCLVKSFSHQQVVRTLLLFDFFRLFLFFICPLFVAVVVVILLKGICWHFQLPQIVAFVSVSASVVVIISISVMLSNSFVVVAAHCA